MTTTCIADLAMSAINESTMESSPIMTAPMLRLRGGKGGFGSMLRAQGGKMSSKKTTNFEACRDLSGRRLKTVNDAKKLADYVEKEPERKRKQKEAAIAKIEEGLKEHQPKKIRFDDQSYVKEHEKVLDDVKDTVQKALQKNVAKITAKKQTEKKAAKFACQMEAIALHLQNTLSPLPNVRKEAEVSLAQIELNPTFPLLLLKLIDASAANPHIARAGAVYFKNFIKKYWKQVEGEQDKLDASDRVNIKSYIVNLMISSPHAIQLQLSEAVYIMAENDFPHNWGNLIGELVSKLTLTDFNANLGVLQTAHSIFKRWRHQFKSDALYTEINLVLGEFAPPYLQFFQATDGLITENANNKEMLQLLFKALLLLTKIFYSVNSQDLPQFFEDHQADFMPILLKYLNYSNPLLVGDDDEPGPIELVKTSICEIIDLYGSKYEEDFHFLKQFVDTVWGLLTTTGTEAKYDSLVSKAIGFLTAVVRPSRHKVFFESPEVLRSICEKIIIPNMTLRESDEELFSDDCMEFIRRDLEGSDFGTRRGAATELVRGLLEHFSENVTVILNSYLSLYLAEYARNKTGNWKAKDTAIFMIIAVSAKASTFQSGVSKVNEHIDVVAAFAANVLPDLQEPLNAIHPLVKAGALKFVMTFRNQLSKAQLLEVMPLVAQHLLSSNYVVQTYAAVCIERILCMRAGNVMMFGKDDVKSYSHTMLTHLFNVIKTNGTTHEKMAENDYLMRAIMRIIIVNKEETLPYAGEMLTQLTKIVEVISKNPSNPKFNHFAFESIGSLIKYLCVNNIQLTAQFEQFLFPPFQSILQQDISEFMPYVFQLMSQLLSFHTEAGIPPAYQSMLPPLLQPPLWESHGNIPALVNMLESYLSKGSAEIVAKQQLAPILGVYHKLIASRMNDHYGLELLTAVFEFVDPQSLQPFMRNIFMLILNRLKASRTPKFTKAVIKFLFSVFVFNRDGLGPDNIIAVFDMIQPMLFRDVARSIIAADLPQMVIPEERRICVLGATRLLTASATMISPDYLEAWAAIRDGVWKLIEAQIAESGDVEDDVYLYLADAEEAGYQATFSKLATSGRKRIDYTAGVADLKQYYMQALTAFKESPAGRMLPPAAFA
ncbi:importin-alpha export receptor [Blyttiomyces sp. JEL0837]|nr:importin-alpha export receptor [Blyttiomyces sp. JEL0837]